MKRGDMNKAEIWETHHKHIFMGAGKLTTNTESADINKKWRQRIIDTEYINERAITTTILVNRHHIKLMSVYFLHSKYAEHMAHCNKHIPIIGGDSNAELGPGKGTESKSVGRYTLYESYKRGDWLKCWLMLHDYSTLNTMFRKTPQKQTSFVLQKEKKNK